MRSAARQSLDPVRWRLPRARTVLRAVAVVALLAAGAFALRLEPARLPPVAVEATPSITAAAPAGRAAIPAGLVGVPVRLAEPAALAVLQPADRVDLLAVIDGATPAVVAAGVTVIDVPDREAGVAFLAVTAVQARQIVGLPEQTRLAVVVRG